MAEEFVSKTDGQIELATPDTLLFHEQSQPFNRRYAPRPAVIAFPTSTDQVAQIVRLARASGLKVAARSGGHSYAAYGLGILDNTVVVDMKHFNQVVVDKATEFATIGSGVRLGEVVERLEREGRALPHGTCPYVGWGGHATMGGYGFTSRMWGFTLDTVIEAEVVLGDGTIVTASKDEHSDLLWGIRGAAPYLGVVTSLKVKTFPLPASATVFSFKWELSVEEASTAIQFYQEHALTADIPPELGIQGDVGRGISRENVSFGFSGAWYGPPDHFDATIKPFLGTLGKAPNVDDIEARRLLTDSQAACKGLLRCKRVKLTRHVLCEESRYAHRIAYDGRSHSAIRGNDGHGGI